MNVDELNHLEAERNRYRNGLTEAMDTIETMVSELNHLCAEANRGRHPDDLCKMASSIARKGEYILNEVEN